MDVIAFADTNVFMDAFLSREPGNKDCQTILDLGKNSSIELYTSSSCLLTVMYLLEKNRVTKQDIIAVVLNTLKFVSLTSAVKNTFKTALSSNFSDLEDAVQYYTALEVKGIDYFITSNIKDYKAAKNSLPVVTPKQLMSLFNKQ